MTPQLELLADTPIARRADPETSKLAAAEITASGDRARQQTQSLRAVGKWPGLTSAELATRIGCDRFITARRLPELRAQGLVENGAARECAETGRKCITWWMKGAAPEVAPG